MRDGHLHGRLPAGPQHLLQGAKEQSHRIRDDHNRARSNPDAAADLHPAAVLHHPAGDIHTRRSLPARPVGCYAAAASQMAHEGEGGGGGERGGEGGRGG